MILNMIRLNQSKARVWKHKTLEQIGSVLTSLHEVHHLSATSLKCCVRARKSGVTFSLGAITALLTDWYLPQVESFPSAGETTLPRRCDSCSGSLILFTKRGLFHRDACLGSSMRGTSCPGRRFALAAERVGRFASLPANVTDCERLDWYEKSESGWGHVLPRFTFSLVSESESRWIVATFSVPSIELNEPGLR